MKSIYTFKKNISVFFSKGNIRSIEAKKNIIESFVIKGLSIIISLLLVPMTIRYVNPTQYGIWLTLSSIVSWIAFFDIGFGNGLRNRYAEAKAKGNMENVRTYISTTYAVLGLIFGSVCLLFFGVNFFIDWSLVLNAPSNMAHELSTLALIVFSFFCLQIVLKTVNTVLIADQKPAKSAFFDMLGQLIALIIIFGLTKTTNGSLVYLGLTIGFAPIVVLLISSFWLYRKQYRQVAPSFKFIKFSYANDIMKLGLKFFIIQIAAIVLFQSNNIIIAQLFGPNDVTYYNISFKYFSVITMIASIIMTPLWSAFTDAWQKDEYNWIKSTIKNLQFIWIILVILTILLLIFSNIAYRLWVGEAISIPFNLSLFIAFNTIIYIWNMIYVHFLNGVGKIKLQLYSGVFGMFTSIPLAIIFGRYIGLSGVVLASIILGLINTTWTYTQYKKIIEKKAMGIWNK